MMLLLLLRHQDNGDSCGDGIGDGVTPGSLRLASRAQTLGSTLPADPGSESLFLTTWNEKRDVYSLLSEHTHTDQYTVVDNAYMFP
jgi:hypothetical protein